MISKLEDKIFNLATKSISGILDKVYLALVKWLRRFEALSPARLSWMMGIWSADMFTISNFEEPPPWGPVMNGSYHAPLASTQSSTDLLQTKSDLNRSL